MPPAVRWYFAVEVTLETVPGPVAEQPQTLVEASWFAEPVRCRPCGALCTALLQRAARHTPPTRSFRRRVKGIVDDYTVVGQQCSCATCRAEHRAAKTQLDAAVEAKAPEEKIEELKSKVKAASYTFMSYDRRVLNFYEQRKELAYIALDFPAYLTHKVRPLAQILAHAPSPPSRCVPPHTPLQAAVAKDAVWLLKHLVRKPIQAHGIEAMLQELRALSAQNDINKYYSYHRKFHEDEGRKERLTGVAPGEEDREFYPYKPTVSSFSDTLITHILNEHFEKSDERYILQWCA